MIKIWVLVPFSVQVQGKNLVAGQYLKPEYALVDFYLLVYKLVVIDKTKLALH